LKRMPKFIKFVLVDKLGCLPSRRLASLVRYTQVQKQKQKTETD
jgi:hypothetical protein